MTPESEAELKANIALLLDLVREQQMMLRDQNTRVNRVAEDVVEIKTRLAALPQPAEFYELRGRVEEISRRLPTTIAYAAPPAGRRDPAE